MLLQGDLTYVTIDVLEPIHLINILLLVPTLAQGIVYKRLLSGWGLDT